MADQNAQTAWLSLKPLHARLMDSAVFATLASLVFYTISKHEPWADEADTWLEARDLPYFRMLFHELRYDGHLPLWHSVVWIGQHVLRLPYSDFVYIGGVCAVAGLAVLIFLAPFPRPLRYVIAGSFFFAYQYAVVARPYVLMPLLGFLAAHFYRRGLPRVTAFAVAIAFLIQDSSYAAVIALGFAAFYAIELARRWSEISAVDRKRAFRAAAIVGASAAFAFIVLLPPADSSLVVDAKSPSFQRHLEILAEGLTGSLANSAIVAVPILLLCAAWAFERRKFLLFLFLVGGTSLEYGFLRGFGHHQGLITIAFVVFLWAAWPAQAQLGALPSRAQWLHQAAYSALFLLFAWHCTWTYKAMRGDWAGPYSGALDAANFLKSIGAGNRGCGGYGFWAVAVQPYFDHNVFLNYGGPAAPAYYHFSTEFVNHADTFTERQAANGPPFLLLAGELSPQDAIPMIEAYRNVNYVLIHTSDGTRFFKGEPGPHSLYLVFERLDFAIAENRAIEQPM